MKINLDVEIARVFGFACVVVAHANSLGMFHNHQVLGYLLDELCRSTVQIFFLVSGFFWRPEQINEPGTYLRRLFPKLAIPFVIWAAVYLTLDAMQVLHPLGEPRTWRSYVTTPWSGGIAFHLWFLPALFVGTGIGMTLIKLSGLDRAVMAVLGLFLIGVVLGTYLHPLGIEVPLSLYRNGIFFAPVFLVAGYYLKTLQALPSLAVFSAMAVFGGLLNLVEGFYVLQSFPSGHDLSLATLPFGVGVFGVFLHLRSNAATVASFGRDVFGAYLVHVLVMKILITLLDPARNLLLVAFCIAMTFLISLLVSRQMKTNRWLRYLAP